MALEIIREGEAPEFEEESHSHDHIALVHRETKFRIGATHGSHWLSRTAARMVKHGASPQQIADRLSDLAQVILDWRENHHRNSKNFPDYGNPWDWPQEVLESYIERERANW